MLIAALIALGAGAYVAWRTGLPAPLAHTTPASSPSPAADAGLDRGAHRIGARATFALATPDTPESEELRCEARDAEYAVALECDGPGGLLWDDLLPDHPGKEMRVRVRARNLSRSATMYAVRVRLLGTDASPWGADDQTVPGNGPHMVNWECGDLQPGDRTDWQETVCCGDLGTPERARLEVSWLAAPPRPVERRPCLQNLHQIQVALAAYTLDHDGALPASPPPGPGVPEWLTGEPYYLQLLPYGDDWGMYSCENAPELTGGPNGSVGGHSVIEAIARGEAPEWFRLSYGYSRCIGSSWDPMSSGSRACQAAGATEPARDVVLGDSPGPIVSWQSIAWANVCSAGCNPDRQVPANTRHQGGSNVLFLDGHVGHVLASEAEGLNYGPKPFGNGRW